MARVNDIVLLDHPADATGPRSINAYLSNVPLTLLGELKRR
jgi:hypothetical protein